MLAMGLVMFAGRRVAALTLGGLALLWGSGAGLGEAAADVSSDAPTTFAASLPPAPAGQQWKLVFADEFDRINPRIWTLRGDSPRNGGYWLKKNVEQRDGALYLRATRHNGKMATGSLDTNGKAQWRYGYFEMRAKLPRLPGGHRPAFWLQTPGTFQPGDEGRDGTEIDIFEAPGRSGHVVHNLHWNMPLAGGMGRNNVGKVAAQPIAYNQWHKFGLWWDADRYRFYVDGVLTWETSEGGVSQVPEHIRITDEVLDSDRFAQVNYAAIDLADPFVVDYVKVYQLQRR